jgi:hypothetical protein
MEETQGMLTEKNTTIIATSQTQNSSLPFNWLERYRPTAHGL